MDNQEFWNATSTIPDLTEDQIHIWKIPLIRKREDLECQLEYLSTYEIERANRFHFEQDRSRFIISHAFLRWILSGYLGLEKKHIRYSYGKHGKPHLEENLTNLGLHFNLAHSADLALVGLCHGKSIGVDIEQIRPLPDMDHIAARFFSEHEQAELAKATEEQKLESFYTLWTCKEAFIKNLGEGLSHPLDQFDVLFSFEKPPRLFDVRSKIQDGNNWQAASFTVDNGYLGAVVSEDLDLSKILYFST